MAILILAMTTLAVVLVSPAQSQSCKSRKFSGRTFAHCSNLSVLSAELHWTYHEANNSLAVSFTAPPPSTGGWVAWGINPTGTGMAGTQAFVAAQRPNGSVTVTTYNIGGYKSIVPAELSFDVLQKSAEISGGNITIFAVVKVPTGKAASLNHIWQVGPGFNSAGWLLKHEFKPENLAAKGTLNLITGSEAISGSPSAAPTPGASNKKNGVASITASFGNLALFSLISLLVLVSL